MTTVASLITKVLLLLVLVAAPLASAFCPPAALQGAATHSSKNTVVCSKKNPKGSPITVQEDEDMAMWFEDKDGKQKKALKKPVGGRPINKLTKEDMAGKGAKKGGKPWWQF